MLGFFVTTHEHIGEFVAGVRGQSAQEQVIDDEQACSGELLAVLAELAELSGLVDFVDQHMRFAIEDAVAMLDGDESERLGDMALAGARFTNEQRILPGVEELERGELEDLALGKLGVVRPVEVLQGLAFGEPGVAEAPLKQAAAAPIELILHEPGEAFEEVAVLGSDLQGALAQPLDKRQEPQSRMAERRGLTGYTTLPMSGVAVRTSSCMPGALIAALTSATRLSILAPKSLSPRILRALVFSSTPALSSKRPA